MSASISPVVLQDVQKGLQALLTVLETLTGGKGVAASGTTAVAGGSTSVGGTLTLGLATDVGEIAGAVTAGEKLAAQIDAEDNTPAMVAAAEKADRQKLVDQLNEALKEHDTETIRKLIANL